MTFEVEINGRIRQVAVEHLAEGSGHFRVRIDAETHDVTAAATDLGLSLTFAAGGRNVDAAVTEQGRGQWLVQLPHVSVTAAVDGRRYERGSMGDTAQAGEQRVLAPMPGRVLRVLVQPGEDVATRQGLVVIEAMKMENELRSPKAGRVKEIAVSEGTSVEAGRLLVIVE